MKVVINTCYGGFSLSEKAYEYLGIEWDGYGISPDLEDECDGCKEFRTLERLVECVEELGADANGRYASLKIVEIPDDVDWYISEYDGWESVEEYHRSWH